MRKKSRKTERWNENGQNFQTLEKEDWTGRVKCFKSAKGQLNFLPRKIVFYAARNRERVSWRHFDWYDAGSLWAHEHCLLCHFNAPLHSHLFHIIWSNKSLMKGKPTCFFFHSFRELQTHLIFRCIIFFSSQKMQRKKSYDFWQRWMGALIRGELA